MASPENFEHQLAAATPPIDSLSVGRLAVHFDMDDLRYMLEDDLPEAPTELVAHTYRAAQEAREEITASAYHMSKSNEYLERFRTESPWLACVLGEAAGEEQHELTAFTIENAGRQPTVSNATFLNFLQWHNSTLAKIQLEMDQASDGHKVAFAGRLKQAVAEGWIPENAIDNLYRLSTVRIFTGDPIVAAGNRIFGAQWHNGDENFIRIVPRWKHSDEYTHTYTHELLHAIVSKNQSSDAAVHNSEIAPNNTGIERTFTGKAGRILDEAVTEHIADSLLNGTVNVIEPLAHERKKSRSYHSERLMLHALCNFGLHTINIRDFIAAYFADTAEPGKHLAEKLKASFPYTNILDELEGLDDTSLIDFSYGLFGRSTAYAREHHMHTTAEQILSRLCDGQPLGAYKPISD